VRNYAGDENLWDVRLVLDEQTEEPCRLGKSLLGWNVVAGQAKDRPARGILILDPQAEIHQNSQPAGCMSVSHHNDP